MQIEKRRYWLSINPDDPSLSVGPAGDNRAMLQSKWALLMVPEIAGHKVTTGPVTLQQTSLPGLSDSVLQLTAPFAGGLQGQVQNTIYLMEDRLVCFASYRLEADHAVRHWHIAGPGSRLGADYLHAMMRIRKRNKANGAHAANGAAEPQAPETNGVEFPADNAEINTAGHNYAYAITGPRMAVRRGNVAMCLGGTSLANDFGLNCRVKDGVIEHLRFNYGDDIPLQLKGKQTHFGPRLQILLTDAAPYETIHGRFIDAMADDGIIQRAVHGPEDAVWRRPIYCTWGDQVLSGKTLSVGLNWKGQKASNHLLDEAFVRRAVDQIIKNEFNIGTIIIDAGWQDKRGDWNLNTQKFPNMRKLVDDLHAMGFKVMMWWAPLQIEAGAAVLERKDMVAGPNKHGDMFFNYESPATREYISRILHRFFSSGSDGWDIDGLKLDWMIEKIYPQPGYNDLEWRGEERCIYQIYRMVHTIGTMYKPQIAITGGASENPHLTPFVAWRALEERFDSANLAHLELHATMMQALRPGGLVKNHLSYDSEYSVETVKRVKAFGGIPEIGIVLPENMKPGTVQAHRAALADVNK